MWVTGLLCVQCVCIFHIWLHCFAVVNYGQWVHALCLSCPGAMWGHQREILPFNQNMLLWCSFWSASQLVLHCACRNWWFGSFSLGNRAWFCGLHHLCMPPHTSFHWGFRLKLVPQVPMDMLSVFCCTSFQFLWEGLPSCFGLGTHLAEFRLWLRVKLDTGNVAHCDHVLDSWRCDVAEFLVGFTDGEWVLCCCYMVETVGAWNCCNGATTQITDGAHATAECQSILCHQASLLRWV